MRRIYWMIALLMLSVAGLCMLTLPTTVGGGRSFTARAANRATNNSYGAHLSSSRGMGKIMDRSVALIPASQVPLPRTSKKTPLQTGKPRQGLSSLPVAAQSMVSATLGRDDARYQVGVSAGALRTQNPAQGLQADFTRQGMEVRSGQTHWRLDLDAYGYGDRLEKVPTAIPHSQANRVEYRRGPLVEWYVNGPAGLEQGFTLNSAPEKTGPGAIASSATPDSGLRTSDSSPLTLALKIGGDLTATADSSAEANGIARAKGLTLRDGHGHAVLRYTGLTAHDATGRTLAAWLEVGQEELRLRVDDAGARYPLVVDPFVQAVKLTASDGASIDSLGSSVAVSSDGGTIVAGAPWAEIASNAIDGAAYIFVMPSGGWASTSTFTAKLTASDGAGGGGFGNAVGISSNGSTIVVGDYEVSLDGGSAEGAAYVFVMPNSGGWVTTSAFAAKLIASDFSFADYFGAAVGISSDGSTIVVGAPYALFGPSLQVGAAYVYVMPNSGGWINANSPQTETVKLNSSAGGGRA